MEDGSWGYSDSPPGSGGNAAERERKRFAKQTNEPYPPAERPIYAPLPEPKPEEEDHEPRSGTALSVTSLVIGIVAVVLAAVFFYRSNVNIKSAETRAEQALIAVDELKHAGGTVPAALKIELMRTSRTLDAMAVEFQGEPESLQKVEQLRLEVKEMLALLEEKESGAPVIDPQPERPAPLADPLPAPTAAQPATGER